MNINNFAPKHVVLDEVKEKAVKYEGTFDELVTLVDEGKVTLTTDKEGNVVGVWVDSGCNDVMLDNLSGQNFAEAYWSKPVMSWLEIILTAKAKGETPVEPKVEEDVDDSYEDEEEDKEESASDFMNDVCTTNAEMAISLKDLPFPGHSLAHRVRMYLRKCFHKCLAKGNPPTIVRDGNMVYVSNIHWGRKLSNAEIARYGY